MKEVKFEEYYQNKEVVSSYDFLRTRGLKGKIFRKLELIFTDLLVKESKNQKILEVGVGTGFIAKLLIKKGKYYGMDISREMLRAAEAVVPRRRLFIGNILNIKTKKRFDKIVAIRVIGHFNKQDAILSLKNMEKILNKKGEVIFNLENKSVLRNCMRRITRWGSTKNYQYSKEEVYEIAEKANLIVEEVLYLDHLFILPLHILNKILGDRLEGVITRIELRLKNIRLMANNFFVRCKKQ